jgi:ankyrin repeat protein/Zn-dependent protease with chaperone function
MMFETETARFLLSVMWQQLWIGSALVLLVSLGLRTVRHLNAATRHWIWVFTLVTVALLPLPAFFPAAAGPQVSAEHAEQVLAQSGMPVGNTAPAFPVSDKKRAERNTISSAVGEAMARPAVARGLATSLVSLWLAGTLWMLLGLLRSAKLAARLRLESQPAPLAAGPADIRLSMFARTPMVVGLWRPSILIPVSLYQHVSREELQRIFEHELAHVRRRDQWLNLLQKLIEAVYFFHPAIRFAARRLDDEREISCDDRAALDERDHYAGSLIRICKAIVAKPTPAALAVGAVRSQSQLTRRIACLMDGKRNHAPDVSRASLALSTLVLIAALACAAEFMPRIAIADEPQSPGADVNRQAQSFGTPLIAAAASGDLAGMRELIEAGADVNEAFADYEPRTPLNAAARGGHLDAVKLLLSHGAEVDRIVSGDATALIDAARNGHVDIVSLLLESGADANRTVPGDGSALIAAALSGRAESVRTLLEYGADPSLAVPGDGTPLAAASIRGNDEVLEMLLEQGANPDVAAEGDPGAMMQAASRGQMAALERLAAAGGDVNQVNLGDGTPLIAAARRGNLPAAEWLLDHGADANLAAEGDGNPLIMAAVNGHTDVISLLLDRGADIDAVVPGDETALIASAGGGAIESVRLLLERGADANLAVPVDGGLFGDAELRSALGQAEAHGHEEIVALLVAHGADR